MPMLPKYHKPNLSPILNKQNLSLIEPRHLTSLYSTLISRPDYSHTGCVQCHLRISNSSSEERNRSDPSTKLIADPTLGTRHSIKITLHWPLLRGTRWILIRQIGCIMHYYPRIISWIEGFIPIWISEFNVFLMGSIHSSLRTAF